MAKAEKWVLARPGHAEAEAAAAQRNRQSDSTGLGRAFWFIMAVAWFNILIASRHTLGAWKIPALIVLLAMFVYAMKPLFPIGQARRYYRLVKEGHIIEPGAYFFKVWDELCQEAGIQLTDEEREAEAKQLFDAASDLSDDLKRRRELKNEGKKRTDEDRLRLEARIRARLLHEVKRLQTQREVQQQLLAQAPPALESGVTPSEVEEQLRILRERDAGKDKRRPEQA